MKKALALLLCIILCFGLCVPALGAYNDDVKVSAVLDPAKLDYDESNDQTVYLTVSLSKSVSLYSMSLQVDIPSGLTLSALESGSSAITLEEDEHYSLDTGRVSWYAGKNKTATDLVILTITVPAGTSGSFKVGVKEIELATAGENNGDNWMEGGSAYATLTVEKFVPTQETTPSASFTATGPDSGKLTGLVNGASYQLTGASPASFTASGTSQAITGVSAGKLTLVKKGNGSTTTDSEAQSITVTKAAKPSLTATQPATIDGKGSIPTDSTHEFSTDGKTFTACSGETTGLEPGTYYVRVKAKGAALASDSQKITIKAFDPNREDTPNATFTATGPSAGTLSNLTSGMKYSIDGGETWTTVSGTSAKLTGLSACTITVMMPGNGSTTTDSDEQTIKVTKAAKPSLTATQPDAVDGKGSIPTTAAHEFSTDGKTFTACSGETTDLEPGTYYVRVKAKGTVLASDSQTITIEKFIPTYTVSFDAGGGTGTMADEKVKEGDYELPACGFTAPAGQEYKAWSIDGVEYNEGYVYKVENDITVVALWQDIKTFTVTFDANGGSGSMASKTFNEGDKLTLPECSFTAPSGKQFKAWSVDGKEYAAGDSITISADITVKAVWEDAEIEPKVIATVCFHLQGGTVSGLKDGQTVEYTEDDIGTALPTATRSGYIFDGWFDKKSGGTQYKKVSESMPADLYAHWTEEEDNTIRVTFRLIGAKLADEDVDLGAKRYMPDYVTWIATTAYEMEEGATVYDLWVKATGDAGIKSVGAAKNYVSAVYAPDSLGGYELAEFTNGKRSGWMYTINGKHPGYGLKEQKLTDGDVVIWHYVNDYAYEVDDWVSEGQWQSLGDGTYYNLWLKAPDRFGGAGGGLKPSGGGGNGGGGSSGDDGKDEDKTSDQENTPVVKDDTITVKPEVEDGEAKAEVGEEAVTEALENCTDDILTVKVDTKDADSVELTLSAEAVKAVSDADADLHIETENGTVKLDADALSELAGSGKDVTVTVQANEDGTTKLAVNVNGKPADVKMKVELPAAEDGQVLVAVHADGTEEIIKKSLVEDGKVYAELPAGATVKIIENAKSFNDVKDSDWFADAVEFASSHELFQGVAEGEFAPKLPMTRAMLVTVLYRLEDEPDAAGTIHFDDVADNTWYSDAVAWAAEAGIVQGTGDGFDPNANVTREQIATILYRYAQKIGLDTSAKGDISRFSDGAKVSSWASDAMAWAVSVGLFRGDDTNSLNPQGDATRAEVATLLERLVKLIVM